MSHNPITQSGVITSFLPLTTAYSAPDGCTTLFEGKEGPGALNLIAFDPILEIANEEGTGVKCLPPEAVSWWLQDSSKESSTVFSLGPVVCPEQYKTAAVSAIDQNSTFVACCPKSYIYVSSFQQGTLGECTSSFSSISAILVDSDSLSITSQFAGPIAGVATAVPVNGYLFATETNLVSIGSPTPTSPPKTSRSATPISSTISTTTTSKSNRNTNKASLVKICIGISIAIGVLNRLVII